jgi:hypothetical protein
VNGEGGLLDYDCYDSDIVGYQPFGGNMLLHLQGEVNGAWIENRVVVFWVMTPCNDMVGYQRFGGPCCLHLQGGMGLG